MRCLIQQGSEWLSFTDPVEVLTARTPDEVVQCLDKIEQSGLWAAGFISYEAASAFDDALQTHEATELPLLQFGLFKKVDRVEPPKSCAEYTLGAWTPSVTRGDYLNSIAAIKEHIAAGDTYQVNYTFRLNAAFSGEPVAFFCDLIAAQQGGYGAFIETDDFSICSASPELFFKLDEGVITAKPMKGTRPRGLTNAADCEAADILKSSVKDRAENIMIVDMIRNDIGRIAEAGSVKTLSHFDVEKYPTVWQMTSTVQGTVKQQNKEYRISNYEGSSLGICSMMKALFPCASITGAPKAKTMEIIRSLEKSPRGIYTGSIGFIAPDGSAQFNVAIRTAVIQNGTAEYGIGGGIVWDSDAESEYEEALSKAAILTQKMPPFDLLETMLYEEGEIFLLERHLKRLAESAEYFDFSIDLDQIRDHLRNQRFESFMRIRLLLSKEGTFNVEAASCRWPLQKNVKLAIAKTPVDSTDLFLYHKTTNRSVYEAAKAGFPEADEVLLYNERGEVTESCIANVVVELDGRKITPPVSCGLLAGTLRDHLLEEGTIFEGVVTLDDLKRAEAIWLINSVRKWRRVELL